MNIEEYNNTIENIHKEILTGRVSKASIKFMSQYGYVIPTQQKDPATITIDDIRKEDGYLTCYQDEIVEKNPDVAREWLRLTLNKKISESMYFKVDQLPDTHPLWQTIPDHNCVFVNNPERFYLRINYEILLTSPPLHAMQVAVKNKNFVHALWTFLSTANDDIFHAPSVMTYLSHILKEYGNFLNSVSGYDNTCVTKTVRRFFEESTKVIPQKVINGMYDVLGEDAIPYVTSLIQNERPVRCPPDNCLNLPNLEKYIIFSSFNNRPIHLSVCSNEVCYEVGKVMALRDVKKLPSQHQDYEHFLRGYIAGGLLKELGFSYDKYLLEKLNVNYTPEEFDLM